MSIAGVGSYAAGNLPQMLSTLLSRLASTSTTSSSSSSDPATTSADGSNALTGRQKPSLSSMILGVLIGMQASAGTSTSGSSSDNSTSSQSDPVQNLFSAIDRDGNGSVSQSELESYIEQKGGSQSEADNLYSMLDASGSSDGISESQLASDVPQPPGPPPSGMDGASWQGTSAASSNDMSQALLKMFDSNGDGSVSKTEFENVVTSNGGSAAQADADYSALDPSGSGSVGASDFATAIEKLQSGTSNDQSPLLTLLDAFAHNTSTTTGTVSLSA